MARKSRKLDFEAALSELEQLVERLEKGDIGLEESLREFQRGVELTRSCQEALKEAEQKIEILTEGQEQADLQPFERED